MANAVTGPTPGCVISRTASGRCRASSADSPVQLDDFRFQPVQRFQQPLAPLGRVGQQGQLLQLRAPCLAPQLAFFLHPVTQRHGLQLILRTGPRLHLLVAMHQQLPHVPHLQTRHPDPRKPVLPQQLQQMLRVPPVGLLLAHYRGPDLGGIAEPQLEAQLRQQPLEPRIVPASLHPHPHFLARQRPVKLLRFGAVL